MARIVDLSIDDREVAEAFQRLIETAEGPAVMLNEIGHHLVETTQRRFADQADPRGRTWAPLSPAYLASDAKRESRYPDKVLLRSGQLQENIFHIVEGQELFVGSPEPYAGVMQFGARRGEFGRSPRGGPIPWGAIPAREFIGLSDADEREIARIVEDHLQDALGRFSL